MSEPVLDSKEEGLYQYRHLSFQEALFAQAVCEGEAPRFLKSLAARLNDPFYLNTFAIEASREEAETTLALVNGQHQEAIDSELSTRVALLSSFHHSLPDETFDAVQRTMGWPAKLDNVVAEADKQAQEDRDNFMEELRQERDRFAEELEAWELEVKALSTLGELAETEKNADLVDQLQAKLEQGRLRAAENNSREELFGWPLTEYPQLNELTGNLEPYLALWTTAVNFQRAYPVWMEGPLLNLSPEQVESDVASWSRQLYKMAKSLVGLEGPLKVVAHVKLKLDEFGEHIPLLQAILNPGMRERHWKKLAEIGRASCRERV